MSAISQTPVAQKPNPVNYATPELKASSGMKLQASRWWVFLALIILGIGFLLPFAFTLVTSFKSLSDSQNPSMVINEFRPENYSDVIKNKDGKFDMGLLTRNTLWIAMLTVVGTTISSAFVAYGFAKIKFKGRGVLFGIMLATMMIPFPVIMVSIFAIWKWLGLHTGIEFLGTYKPLWLPAWFGSAFNIFLLRQFFITVPDELSEAARIDGCSELGIFFRVILPLARPALSVVALFAFMGAWNDYLGPLIFIQTPEKYTLQLGLQALFGQLNATPWNLVMAASILIILPIVILFFLVQKTFIEGIATTGMKG